MPADISVQCSLLRCVILKRSWNISSRDLIYFALHFYASLAMSHFVYSQLMHLFKSPPLPRDPGKRTEPSWAVKAAEAEFSLSDRRSRKRVLLQEGWAGRSHDQMVLAMPKLWNAFQTQVSPYSWHPWATAWAAAWPRRLAAASGSPRLFVPPPASCSVGSPPSVLRQ